MFHVIVFLSRRESTILGSVWLPVPGVLHTWQPVGPRIGRRMSEISAKKGQYHLTVDSENLGIRSTNRESCRVGCVIRYYYFTVEFILGMNGSTMGCLISFIFPAVMFLKVMDSNKKGKFQAKVSVTDIITGRLITGPLYEVM